MVHALSAQSNLLDWLLQWTPADASISLLVLALLLFFMVKIWPYLEKSYFPAKQKEATLRIEFENQSRLAEHETLQHIATTMAELKQIVYQNNLVTTKVLEYLQASMTHSTVNRAAAEARSTTVTTTTTQPRKSRSKKAAVA